MTDPIEQEIQDKGLTAPRVTPERIKEVIVDETYWQPHGTTLTICVLLLQNGTLVTGESACVSPENFDVEIGKKIARKQAEDKVWALEGYLLKQQLHWLETQKVKEAAFAEKHPQPE